MASIAWKKFLPFNKYNSVIHAGGNFEAITFDFAIESLQEQMASSMEQFRYKNSLDHLHLIRESISKFANTKLIVCVVVREPFVIYNEPLEATNQELLPTENLDNYSGVAIEVTKRLAEIFKFKVRVIRPTDGQFGILDHKGHWTGLMGSLVRNESQLGVTALSITSSRAEAVDFTRAYYVETSALLLKIPEEVQDFLVIFEPFSPLVWFVLFVTIVFLVLVIMLMTKLEDNERLKHQMVKEMRSRGHDAWARLRANSDDSALSRLASFFVSRLFPSAPNSAKAQEKATPIDEPIKTKDILDKVQTSEFGSNWTERFYYSVTCVLNILLNKGK